MFGMGPMELMIIGAIAVLLFGSKLPEVARSLGSSYKEFKKGLNEFQTATQYDEPSQGSGGKSSYDYDEYDDTATAPRFEPPPGEEGAETPEGQSASDESASDESATGESESGPDETLTAGAGIAETVVSQATVEAQSDALNESEASEPKSS
jgi:sec-independent protein translocase protein TatA